MAMTEHLKTAYKLIKNKYPTEIFRPGDLYAMPFNRPQWVCDRLVEEGKLVNKTKITFDPVHFDCMYQCVGNEC